MLRVYKHAHLPDCTAQTCPGNVPGWAGVHTDVMLTIQSHITLSSMAWSSESFIAAVGIMDLEKDSVNHGHLPANNNHSSPLCKTLQITEFLDLEEFDWSFSSPDLESEWLWWVLVFR